MITPRRLSRMATNPLSLAEALQWLCVAEPTSKEYLATLAAWTDKTPIRVAIAEVMCQCYPVLVLWPNNVCLTKLHCEKNVGMHS